VNGCVESGKHWQQWAIVSCASRKSNTPLEGIGSLGDLLDVHARTDLRQSTLTFFRGVRLRGHKPWMASCQLGVASAWNSPGWLLTPQKARWIFQRSCSPTGPRNHRRAGETLFERVTEAPTQRIEEN